VIAGREQSVGADFVIEQDHLLRLGMQTGLTSDAETLEAWPFEPSFECRLPTEQALLRKLLA
jgi:hypothetical protein